MALTPGSRFGSYEISAQIGVGGMGEVYRARDTKLNRDVALKVLPDLFANDPERLARFEREAQVLASLNHPHIAHIYGIEEAPKGQRALVLELVEGPTLADRIARGPVPLAEAIAIAQQIADALDTAHEQGVIHRDLKPANIKLKGAWAPTPTRLPDGRLEPALSASGVSGCTVKVLDFGLAKAMAPDAASGATGAMNSPTMSARATEMGIILGTAAYMSPEQAKGKPADRRADVWAFGVVLFEMLTGRQAFTGETPSEVMASVMKEEPDWSVVPANLPASIRRLLKRCLEKDPKKRLSSMSDVRLELSEKDAPAVETPAVGAVRTSWLSVAIAAVAGVAVTTAAFVFVAPRLGSAPAREAARVSVLGPEGVTLYFDAAESSISPDGRSLAFTTSDPSGATKLWVRSLAALESRPIAGTEGGRLPFWSPDSRQIAFFTNDKLKKVPAAGGTVEPLCDAKDGRGGSWGTQDVIVFAPANAGALQSVSANGGEPKTTTTLDAARGETGHRFPSFLPDGRHFLFATLPSKDQKHDLFVGSIEGTRSGPLTSAAGAAVYAEPGYILYTRQNVLVAQAFDARTRTLSGEAVAIGDAPSAAGAQYAAGRAVSVSRTGTLAYLGDRLPDTKLRWLDRSGRETGTLTVPEGRYQEIAFAPDGRRAAIVRFASQNETDIWIADVERGGANRFTSAPGVNFDVVWSPAGDRLLFSSDRAGPRDFFIKPASGATPEEPYFTSKALFKDSRTWSPDGKWMVFEELDPQTNRDLWVLPMDGDASAAGVTPGAARVPKLYLRTAFNEQFASISPDGKWIAYASDESGRFEVYVDAFPVPRNKFKVTDRGAIGAFWRKDSRELAITSADGRSILVSEISAGAELHASAPRQLLSLPKGTVFATPTPDLQRMLVSVAVTDNSTSSLTLVFDWLGALKK